MPRILVAVDTKSSAWDIEQQLDGLWKLNCCSIFMLKMPDDAADQFAERNQA